MVEGITQHLYEHHATLNQFWPIFLFYIRFLEPLVLWYFQQIQNGILDQGSVNEAKEKLLFFPYRYQAGDPIYLNSRDGERFK